MCTGGQLLPGAGTTAAQHLWSRRAHIERGAFLLKRASGVRLPVLMLTSQVQFNRKETAAIRWMCIMWLVVKVQIEIVFVRQPIDGSDATSGPRETRSPPRR